MKLVVVEAGFPAEKMDEAIRLFEGQAGGVRAVEGCAHYAVFRAPDAARVAIVQHWTSMEAFDAYRGSPAMAALGQGLKPIMAGPPTTTIAEVDG